MPFEIDLEEITKIYDTFNCVYIDKKRLIEIAKKMAKKELPAPTWRSRFQFPEKDDIWLIQFLGVTTAVNFAFTDFEYPHKKFMMDWNGQTFTGSETLGACFMRVLEENIPVLSANFLENISLNQVKYIFRGKNFLPLMEARMSILRDVGKVLKERYCGFFSNLFNEADYCALREDRKGIIQQLKNFKGYNDVVKFSEQEITFMKKAKLLILLYQGRVLSSGENSQLWPIKDIDLVGPVADYAVPAALATMGILRYKKHLYEIIKSRQKIKRNSQEEIEVRCATILAMELLRKEINTRRMSARKEKINMVHLDYAIWSKGRANMVSVPQHLTETIYY